MGGTGDITSDRLRPLSGLTAVEVGGGWPALLLSKLLYDQGMSILRVSGDIEIPPENRICPVAAKAIAAPFQMLAFNRDTPDALREVISKADLLIDAVPPAGWVALGGCPDALACEAQGPIRLTLPGFPTKDAERSPQPPWEGALDAAAGEYTDLGLLRGFLGLDPVYSASPYAAVYGALHAAIAAIAALRSRSRGTSMARRIEVPLAAAALSAMSTQVLSVKEQPQRYDAPPVPRWLQSLMPALRRALHLAPRGIQDFAVRTATRLTPPFMDTYRCRDGRLLYVFAMDHDRAPRELLRHLGCLDNLKAAGLGETDAYHPATRNNIREGAIMSPSWRRRVRTAISEVLATQDAKVWETQLSAAGIPCSLVRKTVEWLGCPELHTQGLVELDEIEGLGQVRRPGPAVSIHRSGEEAASAEEHIGTGEGLLSGVRVLDLSAVVAGPVAARTLAEYGADVIKVLSPSPRHGPRITCWYGVDVDRGKRSVALDLASKRGRRVFERMVAEADVVIHNFTDSAVRKLGLSPKALGSTRPGIVICRVSAFRGPKQGPWSDRRGYDPVLQAASGIMERYGDPGKPEHHGIASCVDFATGYLAAFGTMLGLQARGMGMGGNALVTETSLAQGALLIQGKHALEVNGVLPAAQSGQGARGEHALQRLYKTRDGWIFLATDKTNLDPILRALELDLDGPRDVADAVVATAMERRIRGLTLGELGARLSSIRVALQPVGSLETQREEWLSGLKPGDPVTDGPFAQIVRAVHPAGGHVDVLAPGWARITDAPLRVPAQAPKPGADTEQILREHGLGSDEIAELIHTGIAATEIAGSYLPV